MTLPAQASDQLDNTLRDRLNEAHARNEQNPTPENREAYKQAFKVFVDWVLRRKLPDDIDTEQTSAPKRGL